MPKIRKGDEVLIIAGKDKGQRGKVLRVLEGKGRVEVEGRNIVKRHLKAGSRGGAQRQGGIVDQVAPIHISNVMLISADTNEPGRSATRFLGKDGNKFGSEQEARASFGKKGAGTKPAKLRVVLPNKRGI